MDAFLEKEKLLNVYINELEDDVQKRLDERIVATKHDIEEDNSSISKIIEDVEKFREEMKQVMNHQCDSIIETLRKPNVDKSNFLSMLHKQKRDVDIMRNQCKEKLIEGKLDLIEYNPPACLSVVPKRPDIPSVKAKFVPDNQILDFIKKGVGRVECQRNRDTLGKVEYDNSTYETPIVENIEKNKLQVQVVGQFKSKIDITSIAIAGKNAWVAGTRSDTLFFHDDNGEVIGKVTVAKGIGIKDITVMPTGDIIVTSKDKKVRRVSVEGSVTIVRALVDTTPFEPYGVCLTDTEQIVVCMSEMGNKNHVAIFTPDGRSKVSEIRGSDVNNKHAITDPYRVVQNGKDLCVVNYGENVVCVSQEEALIWKYDGKKANIFKKFYPRGICCDKYHNILVSDSNNHCVHYINRKGQLIQVLPIDAQTDLLTVDVDDEAGRVWLGNSKRQIVIVKYIKWLSVTLFLRALVLAFLLKFTLEQSYLYSSIYTNGSLSDGSE